MADLTPPASEAEALHWLRLIRSRRVGPATFRRLMIAHGSAAAALEALPKIAAEAGVDDYATCPADRVAQEYETGVRLGARLVALGSRTYPAALTGIADAPPLLWLLGQPELARKPAVALVGARNASALGLRTARRLGAGLGTSGLVVISGLARGIDAAAHEATLPTGTIAVLAGGLDCPYPPENLALAQRIRAEGLLVSEQPFGLAPGARHFPRRNRLISGLARAVVVVEAARGSGSLITARDALDQGREVMAVPAHPFDPRGGGCLDLLRDGATLVRGPEDVLEALGAVPAHPFDPRGGGCLDLLRDGATLVRGPEDVLEALGAAPDSAKGDAAPLTDPAPPPADRDAVQARILDRLSVSPAPEDALHRDLAMPPGDLAPHLTELELAGVIARQPGGLLSRVA
jgi:DNA processing protein